jgi:molybdopterin-biosynthesis enzyme MoeA-like protein
VLPNPHGTAPGFLLRDGDVRFVAMPGPPREMQPCSSTVLPKVAKKPEFEVWTGKLVRHRKGRWTRW